MLLLDVESKAQQHGWRVGRREVQLAGLALADASAIWGSETPGLASQSAHLGCWQAPKLKQSKQQTLGH